MIALKCAMFKGANMDDKRLAQDLEKLMTKTIVTVDWPFAINLNYYGANGARPFYGQNMLKVVKLPNMVLSKADSGYGSNYLDGTAALEELWLDSIQAFPNSLTPSGVLRYVYAPSFAWGKNFFNATRATGAVFDMGQSRTCAEFLAAMPTSFENLSNVWKGWTFRCSDGDVVWNGSEWVKS